MCYSTGTKCWGCGTAYDPIQVGKCPKCGETEGFEVEDPRFPEVKLPKNKQNEQGIRQETLQKVS